MKEDKLMTGIHIIANQDPIKCQADIEDFTKQKKDVKLHYSTTPVLMSAQHGHANLQIICTCLILWQCTEKEWQTHIFTQKTLIQKQLM